MPRIINYIMTHDEGFAPNPFFGFLSLATCKPQIRNIAQPGDWIAGWGARFLCGRGRNQESLVYLAEVKAVMTMADYWQMHPEKRVPKAYLGRTDEPQCLGDNIYQPNGQGGYIQQLNNNHCSCGDKFPNPCPCQKLCVSLHPIKDMTYATQSISPAISR